MADNVNHPAHYETGQFECIEVLTDTYCVFFGDRPCYKVDNPSEDFYKDMIKRQMVSLSEAKNRY